jgi:hypothetical protein
MIVRFLQAIACDVDSDFGTSVAYVIRGLELCKEERVRNTRFLILIGLMAMLLVGCEDKKVVEYVGSIPAVPTGVTSTTGDRSVTVQWPGNNDDGLTEGYGVYRYTGTVNGTDRYELIANISATDHDPIPENSDVVWYSYTDQNRTNGDTYYYAVNAYNAYGESELSAVDAMDTPRPDGSATLKDFRQYPDDAGFDFSREQIVAYNSNNADIYFEYDPDLDAFFFFAAHDSVDIQSYGYTGTLTDVGWGDPGGGDGWSQVGWMELVNHHSYIVWTADNHYATFRVTALNPETKSISIDWAYQTDQGNPELKRAPIVRPPHAANYGRRDG